MTTYGFRRRDSLGVPNLSITNRITRMRFSTIAQINETGSTIIDDINDHDYVISAIRLGDFVDIEGNLYFPHEVTVSGTTLSWTHKNAPTAIFLFYYT